VPGDSSSYPDAGQLPPASPAFTGRTAELERLDAILASAGHKDSGGGSGGIPAATVAVLSGTAGVGKTTLAAQWAHRIASQFPDGRLYANLRGLDPGGRAQDPAQVVRGFLEASGIPAEEIPQDLDARVGLFRSVLTNRRVLIVLDDARDEEQVRPLLPGAPGSLVVVTSRDRLAGLVAEGAQAVALELPTVQQARELLARRLGAFRVAAEPEAADEIVAHCGRLPLALAVVAAHLTVYGRCSLAEFVAGHRQGAPDCADGPDAAADVRTVFSWSYDALSPEAASLFRRMSSYPGPDISAAAAADIAGVDRQQAASLLAELTRAHLLTETAPRRCAFHDLLRAYAIEQARAHDDEQQRREARHRVLDH
jgi:hypothetical protein